MMNHSTRTMRRPRRARPLPARTAAAIIATAGLALLAAACGGSPSSAGSNRPPSAGGAANSSSLVGYSRCVRSHGVPNFPDPESSGGIPKETAQQLGVSLSRVQAAQMACAHLLPAGHSLSGKASTPITAQEQQDYLRAAACMRSHGITNFPDPTFSGGQVNFPIPSSIDTRSTRFTQARQTCAKLIPAGLPYNGSGS